MFPLQEHLFLTYYNSLHRCRRGAVRPYTPELRKKDREEVAMEQTLHEADYQDVLHLKRFRAAANLVLYGDVHKDGPTDEQGNWLHEFTPCQMVEVNLREIAEKYAERDLKNVVDGSEIILESRLGRREFVLERPEHPARWLFEAPESTDFRALWTEFQAEHGYFPLEWSAVEFGFNRDEWPADPTEEQRDAMEVEEHLALDCFEILRVKERQAWADHFAKLLGILDMRGEPSPNRVVDAFEEWLKQAHRFRRKPFTYVHF